MEPIVVIVGFLGAGKTTLLKKLVQDYLGQKWKPFVVLNDYENARIDSQQFSQFLDANDVNALDGSCICCSGVSELRQSINDIPKREKGITFIEANGTTDACTLMGFLGVGINEIFFLQFKFLLLTHEIGLNEGMKMNSKRIRFRFHPSSSSITPMMLIKRGWMKSNHIFRI